MSQRVSMSFLSFNLYPLSLLPSLFPLLSPYTPYQLVQLHILTEIEHGFGFLLARRREEEERGVPESSLKINESGEKRAKRGRIESLPNILSPIMRRGEKGEKCIDLFNDEPTEEREERRERREWSVTGTLNWDMRLDMLSTSLRTRNLLMAVRRAILAIGGRREEVGKNWLELSDIMLKSGRTSLSFIFLLSLVSLLSFIFLLFSLSLLSLVSPFSLYSHLCNHLLSSLPR